VLRHLLWDRSSREFGRRCFPIPGQELIQSLDVVIVDAREYVGEPYLGIDVVELGALKQRQHDCGALAAAVGAGEQPGFAAGGNSAQRALGGVVAQRPAMPAIYAALAQHERRNNLIFDDVLKSLEAGRSPIVLTERKDHLEHLQKRFSRFVRNLVVLRGGMSAGERRNADAALRVPGDQERLIPATGRYIGEGFDDPRLDTLFRTMPISWKGTLAQYVGRLHRQHDGKSDVLVVDYVDDAVPVLARMAVKRRAGYRALGYVTEQPDGFSMKAALSNRSQSITNESPVNSPMQNGNSKIPN
jgi:hypothetical protein